MVTDPTAPNQHQKVIIQHGMPSKEEYEDTRRPSASNGHWIPWLQNQLLTRGYDAQTPEVLNAYKPVYDLWRGYFERHVVESELMRFVGHSCGAGFLLRWLSERPDFEVDTLCLVAPWMDPQRRHTTDFFDFDIDPTLVDRVRNFHWFHSLDDTPSIQLTAELIRKSISGINYHEYTNMGHFCTANMLTVGFPDLLDAVTA